MVMEERDVRKIRGDGLCVKLHSNEQILEIIGDGCSVTLANNCGSVRIIGDGCRLRIDVNLGDVEYTGDGGRVLLGPKSSRIKVKYVGDGGRVTVEDSKTRNRKFEQPSKEKIETKDAAGDKDPSGGVEETENVLNARKEAKRLAGEKKPEKVVKIVTRFQCGEQQKIVSSWFANPGSVVRSFDGASFVKMGSKGIKTKIEVK